MAKQIKRFSFPVDEARYDWLRILLDAYYIVDIGSAEGLVKEERKRKSKVACHKGCHNCCLKPSVPITPLEIQGLSWFSSEKLKNPLRQVVKKQLFKHKQTTQCPFLVERLCAIYPVRPIACRHYFVFGLPCEPDEDPFLTRTKDIWSPGREVAQKASFEMLPFYGITDKNKQLIAFESGYILNISEQMHTLDWTAIGYAIELFDSVGS